MVIELFPGGSAVHGQYLASTLAVALSGVLVSRWGFRFAIKTGLLLMSAGVGLLLAGPKVMGILCIAAYGGGLGLAVPAANLLVAEVNPGRRSATLNLLNFCWSAGAVSCPFLVAAAVKSHAVPLFLGAVAGIRAVDGDWDCGHAVRRLLSLWRGKMRAEDGPCNSMEARRFADVWRRCSFFMSAWRTVSGDGWRPMPRAWGT